MWHCPLLVHITGGARTYIGPTIPIVKQLEQCTTKGDLKTLKSNLNEMLGYIQQDLDIANKKKRIGRSDPGDVTIFEASERVHAGMVGEGKSKRYVIYMLACPQSKLGNQKHPRNSSETPIGLHMPVTLEHVQESWYSS